MDKLRQNKFLTGMGVLAGVAAVAFGILVVPQWTDAGTKAKAIAASVGKITKELEDLPGDPNVKAWADHSESLKKRYAGSPAGGLLKQQTLDKNLGQWFDGIEDSSTLSTFYTPYDDQRQKLEEELLEKGVLLGSPQDKDGVPFESRQPGFNWVTRTDIVRAGSTDDEMKAKELLQKRFNIKRAIVNAVTADVDKKARPRRLLDVTFLEKFPYAAVSAGAITDATGGKTYLIPIDYTRYAGYAGPGKGNFTEQLLPRNGDRPLPAAEAEASKPGETAPASAPASDDKKELPLGRTLTFGFAMVMDYADVPVLVRNLVAPSVEPDLNLSIVGLNVFVHTPNPAQKKETFRIPPSNEEEIQEKIRQLNAAAQPPQVHVYITCQVFDFNPAAVPSFIKP